MYIVIDTETTGLPTGKYSYDFKNMYAYSTARLVSVAWIILDKDKEELTRKNFIVKPDNFNVPIESTNIHGITHEQAINEGMNLIDVLSSLYHDLNCYDVKMMVAHNLKFDYGVIMSEITRLHQNCDHMIKLRSIGLVVDDLRKKIPCLGKLCTMQIAKDCGLMFRYPKLRDLYAYFNDGIFPDVEHNALQDVLSCVKCLKCLI